MICSFLIWAFFNTEQHEQYKQKYCEVITDRNSLQKQLTSLSKVVKEMTSIVSSSGSVEAVKVKGKKIKHLLIRILGKCMYHEPTKCANQYKIHKTARV